MDIAKQSNDIAGYIYLLKGDQYYKIGVTLDMDNRLGQISPQLPFPIKIIFSAKVLDRYGIEKFLHSYFDEKRTNGEWFRLDNEDVQFIRKTVKELKHRKFPNSHIKEGMPSLVPIERETITVKLYLYPDRDADLLRDWARYPHQEKSKAVKEIWRKAIQSPDEQNGELDWGKLRGIIEAALDSRGVAIGHGAATEEKKDNPLDRLDNELLLD